MFSFDEPSWLGRLTSRPETGVAEPRIFARVEGDTQWLTYQIRVATSIDVAMILPVRVVPGTGERASSTSSTFSLPSRGKTISSPARSRVDMSRVSGVVDGDLRVGRRMIFGEHDNEDTWVDVTARSG